MSTLSRTNNAVVITGSVGEDDEGEVEPTPEPEVEPSHPGAKEDDEQQKLEGPIPPGMK